MEKPAPEEVLAGDSLHYDAEGNACALCVRCLQPIDLEFGDYVEKYFSFKPHCAGSPSKRKIFSK